MANSFKKLFISFVILAVLFAAFYVLRGTKILSNSKSSSALTSPISLQPSEPPAKTENNQVNSADGSMTLIMKKVSKGADPISYSFFALNNSSNDQKLIFTKALTSGEFSIPANAWSPDNRTFFIKQTDGNTLTFLVFNANGDNFSQSQQYLDIASLFQQQKISYNLLDVTGWDAETLLHVVTGSNGTRGPNFWFDIQSQSFIQLAR